MRGRKCVPCTGNEHFRSVNFVAPSSCVQHTNIRNIALCSFLTSFVHWKSRDARCSKALYTALFARCAIFFLFSLSLSLSVCARVYRSPGFVWKKGRDTFLITRAAFGYIDLWPLTRDFLLLFSLFFPQRYPVFRFRIVGMERNFRSIVNPFEIKYFELRK